MSSDKTAAKPAAEPLPPSTGWREVKEPGEEERFKDFADYIRSRQRKLLEQRPEIAKLTGGRPLRGFHAKPHAGLAAEFEVLADIPAHARFGVFAVPCVFPAVVRFSNGTHMLQPDHSVEPRGIAVKLFGEIGRAHV
jgi:hypothetical protein